MTLAARLAETGASVLLAYGERLPGGRGYHLHVLPLQQALPAEDSLLVRTAHLNSELEAVIRQCPEQYLWGYNRYKVPAGAPPPPC
jgi:KDO2-lipid IV(A) lauroyltransferase